MQDDLITRQAVFEQINCWIGSGEYRYTNATHYLTERVKHISPVNPQKPLEDLCEYFGGAKDILNSREDFKAWLARIKWHIHKAEELYEKYEQEPKYCDRNICISNEYNGIGCDECEVTKSQEPKTGHWIDTGSESFEFHRVYKCSECGNTEIEYPEGIRGHFRYCPNCGARMLESQEGSEE